MATLPPTNQKRDQTAWNIAMQHSQFTGGLVTRGFNAFLRGELENWFWSFNTLREIINHDLIAKEILELDAMEKKIFSLLKGGRALDKVAFREAVTPYQRRVLQIMKAQGYFPTKEDRTKLSF